MYVFSEDEQHLLFMDCFGLTRLSFPNHLVTERRNSGSESGGRVSISRDGSVAISYADLLDKTVLWTFPGLRPAQRLGYSGRGALVHPEGTHAIIEAYSGLRLEPLRPPVLLPLRLDAPVDRERSNTDVRVSLEGGRQLAKLVLGGDGQPDVPTPLRVAHDGTLLCYHRGEVLCATLTRTRAEVHWRRAVTTPEGARLELHAEAKRCALLLHRGLRWTVVTLARGRERSLEIESLGVPAVAGRTVVHQPAPDRLVRRNLETGRQTKLPLPEQGVGTIFLGKTRLLFLAADRERILDPIANIELPRELPPEQRAVRQDLLQLVRPTVEAARLAGVCVELGRVTLGPKTDTASVEFRLAGGENLLGALLAGHVTSIWQDRTLPSGWRTRHYKSDCSITYDPDVTVEQLVEAYAVLHERGLGFASTIPFWWRQFDHRGQPPRDPAALAVLAQALIAVVRDGPDVQLDFAELAARGRPAIDAIVSAYDHYSRTAEQLGYQATRLAGALFNRIHKADAARLWMALYLDAEDWQDHGSHYGDIGPYGLGDLLELHPEVTEQFVTWFRTHELPDQDEDRRDYLEQLRRSLRA